MKSRRSCIPEHRAEENITIWTESLSAIDYVMLHTAPVYYGLGVPRGDDSAVVLVPGFLTSDLFLKPLHLWLKRIGYRPYESDIGVNVECPNLLIKKYLSATVARARKETKRKVHLIGHSLGGVIARSVAVQRPDDIASVITLGSPFRGIVVHPAVYEMTGVVRKRILRKHGQRVTSDCYTPKCTCDFSKSMSCSFPRSVDETAIYTHSDGVVDWKYCRTEKSRTDFQVPGTHLGLPFNASVYELIAQRLAEANVRGQARARRAASRTRAARGKMRAGELQAGGSPE